MPRPEKPLPLISALLFFGFWEMGVRFSSLDSSILPSPLAVLSTIYWQWPQLSHHLEMTMMVALLGLAGGVMFSLVGGVLMGRFHLAKRLFYPLAFVSQAIPVIFIYPLFIIWFGFGLTVKIVLVAVICFFPMIVNLLDSLDRADRDLIALFRSMRAGPWRILLTVSLPSALPAFFSGMRVSATYSVLGAVIAEWLGAIRGIGVYMMRSYKSFHTTHVFAAITLVVAFSLLLSRLVAVLERRVVTWQTSETH